MNAMTDTLRPHQAVREATTDAPLREQMEATARAHLAADNAQVDAAMGSVRWERRGLLQRLTRAAR
jgi:hypothetical protein